jgi:hypothetical protein
MVCFLLCPELPVYDGLMRRPRRPKMLVVGLAVIIDRRVRCSHATIINDERQLQ